MIESTGFGYSLLMFLIVLTVLVFVHEMGHYWVARRNGVRVDVFSIGFGPEIFGWTDSVGTRWKVSWVPLGGYVKFFGDMDVASRPDPSMTPEVQNALRASGDDSERDPADPSMHLLTDEEKAVAFPYKKLWQRAAIVAAGPAANFVFAIVVFAGLFMTVGQPYTPAKVGTVEPNSAAAEAGILPGDKIIQVGSTRIDRFEDLIQVISMSPGEKLKIVVERDGKDVTLTATPKLVTDTDAFGDEHRIGRLGVGRIGVDYIKRGPLEALGYAVVETGNTVKLILKSVGQLIVGERSTDELRGPLTIAKMSGQIAHTGFIDLISFMALLSINLGLINLFPIPMLDGGHLLFYGFEAVRGRPLGLRAQEYGFRIGLVMVLFLMIQAIWNDFKSLSVFDYVSGLFS